MREKKKKKFRVTVERMLIVSGTIDVEVEDGENEAEAVSNVRQMIRDGMRTTDKRISWDDPEYVDFSLRTTGDVDEV